MTTIQIRADLHVHTTYSNDSLITPKHLIHYAKKNGLNAVAVTDHNYLTGALKIAKDTKDFLIIPGIEISSTNGHIIALNITEPIPQGLTATETIEHIHTLDGTAIACHPYVYFKGCLRNNVNNKFDAIEVINARAFPFQNSIKKAKETAEKLRLPQVAGTDAHYGPQIGYAYTTIDTTEPTAEAIAKAIKHGHCQAHGQQVPPVLNLQQQIQRLQRMVNKIALKI
ncbi:MAG: CehA/McbA family metallohydrolase [Nitrososphaerota archaeon]|jgi:predicted metal-dependent phosphoesterase TrpH|nr:CehA/McbA family metallohydrolase [Nitrososphaerota archaeon]